MKTKNINQELIKGSKALDGKYLKVVAIEQENDWWIRRIAVVDESGQGFIFQGDTAINILMEVKPEPVTKYRLKGHYKSCDIDQLFSTEEDCKNAILELGEHWTCTIVPEVQELKAAL